MEDIKVGEYVRLEGGYIRQYIKRSLDNHIILDKAVQGFNYLTSVEEKEKIIKHSSNLIDLIEVGDYVNGNKVFATDNRINDNGEKVILTENYDEWTDNGVISNKDIKSIVTKECFQSVSYEV